MRARTVVLAPARASEVSSLSGLNISCSPSAFVIKTLFISRLKYNLLSDCFYWRRRASEIQERSSCISEPRSQHRFNTSQLAARLCEQSELRQYLGACPEEPLLSPLRPNIVRHRKRQWTDPAKRCEVLEKTRPARFPSHQWSL